MSSQEIEALKANVDIVEIVQNFVDLEYRGSNYVGLCPFHSERTPSFNVNPNKGIFKCFGCGASGDHIEFLKHMGNTFKETLQILKGEKEINGSVVSKATPKAPVAEFVYIKPTHRFTLEDYKHFKHGYPDNVYEYFNEDNEFIGSVLRFNLPDGSKITPPYNSRICVKGGYKIQKKGVGIGKVYSIGDIESTFCGFGYYPIYGIEKLKIYPNAKVFLLEGEKNCDVISRLFEPDKVIALSCIGGTGNVDKTDFSPINDRVCYLFPDNDKPGKELMTKIWLYLEENNEIHVVNPPESKPPKWDIADEDWTKEELIKYIKERI